MTETSPKKRPDMTIYFVPERENAPWTPIGAAWQHQDGEGYTLRFELMPAAPGTINLRKPGRLSNADTSPYPSALPFPWPRQ